MILFNCFTSKINRLHCVKCVQIRSFFWSVFSRIRNQYGEILCISPYSVRMRKNTNQKNSVFGHFSRSVIITVVSLNVHQRNVVCNYKMSKESLSRKRSIAVVNLQINTFTMKERDECKQKLLQLVLWNKQAVFMEQGYNGFLQTIKHSTLQIFLNQTQTTCYNGWLQ